MTTSKPAAAAVKTDGRHDFDFAFGRWRCHNRKIVNVLDLSCEEWEEYDAIVEMRPILGGLGNIDTLVPVGRPDDKQYEGATLRLYDPPTDVWRLWWMSSKTPGQLDVPMEGRFTDGRGLFYCDEEIDGKMVKVRYEWLDLEPGSTRWQQCFSLDGGQTWKANWTITSSRIADL
jgi:hypothetical protein